MLSTVNVVVMAAGKSTRMKCMQPKVLHCLGWRALAQPMIDCASRLSARFMVVVITGHNAEQVETCYPLGWRRLDFDPVPTLD